MTRKKELFNLLNTYFDHIYLITLRKSTDRHDRLEDILEGLEYEFFWGVDGSRVNMNKIQEAGLYNDALAKTEVPYGKVLTRGEIGCALSHVEVYRDILKKGYQKALILEDDLAVSPDAAKELRESFTELPGRWDLLYLGYLYNNNRKKFSSLFRIYFAYPILNIAGIEKYDPKKLYCKYPRAYSEHLDRSGYHYGTHAYAVTASGAEKILNRQTPICMASDNAIGMMCMEESITAFRVKRRVFHQNRNLASTIEGRYDT